MSIESSNKSVSETVIPTSEEAELLAHHDELARLAEEAGVSPDLAGVELTDLNNLVQGARKDHIEREAKKSAERRHQEQKAAAEATRKAAEARKKLENLKIDTVVDVSSKESVDDHRRLQARLRNMDNHKDYFDTFAAKNLQPAVRNNDPYAVLGRIEGAKERDDKTMLLDTFDPANNVNAMRDALESSNLSLEDLAKLRATAKNKQDTASWSTINEFIKETEEHNKDEAHVRKIGSLKRARRMGVKPVVTSYTNATKVKTYTLNPLRSDEVQPAPALSDVKYGPEQENTGLKTREELLEEISAKIPTAEGDKGYDVVLDWITSDNPGTRTLSNLESTMRSKGIDLDSEQISLILEHQLIDGYIEQTPQDKTTQSPIEFSVTTKYRDEQDQKRIADARAQAAAAHKDDATDQADSGDSQPDDDGSDPDARITTVLGSNDVPDLTRAHGGDTPKMRADTEISDLIAQAYGNLNKPGATRQEKKTATKFIKDMRNGKKYAAKHAEIVARLERENQGQVSPDTPQKTQKKRVRNAKAAAKDNGKSKKEPVIERLARRAGRTGYKATRGVFATKSNDNNNDNVDTKLDKVARISGRTVGKLGRASVQGMINIYAPAARFDSDESSTQNNGNTVSLQKQRDRSIGKAVLKIGSKASILGKSKDGKSRSQRRTEKNLEKVQQRQAAETLAIMQSRDDDRDMADASR